MLARLWIGEEPQEIVEITKLEVAQHQTLRLDARSGAKALLGIVERKQLIATGLFLAERQAAEALVEARDLPAF
jgi:hypothetical protein